MKYMKRFSIILLLCFSFSRLLLAEDSFAKIIGDLGEVKVKPKDNKKWFKPIIGMALKEKDIIITGAKSWVTVYYQGGSLLQIAQNSAIEISKLEYDSKLEKLDTVIHISGFGKVYLVIQKQKENSDVQFIINTPTAEALVQGIDFMVNVPDMDSSIFAVFKGKIYVHDFLTKESLLTNHFALNEGFVHNLTLENEQFSIYEKDRGLAIAKKINHQFYEDTKIINKLNDQAEEVKKQLIKENFSDNWVDSLKIRGETFK